MTSAPEAPLAPDSITADDLPRLLLNDTCVKLAGVDVDGILRGKLVSKTKFLHIAQSGFGFCSVIFGWDMHDQTYLRELKVSNAENGYRDLIAIPDIRTFRRIPWEHNIPFFLIHFLDPITKEPVSPCPRGLLKNQVQRWQSRGYRAIAGGWSSFFFFPLLFVRTSSSAPAGRPPDLSKLTGTTQYSRVRVLYFPDSRFY